MSDKPTTSNSHISIPIASIVTIGTTLLISVLGYCGKLVYEMRVTIVKHEQTICALETKYNDLNADYKELHKTVVNLRVSLEHEKLERLEMIVKVLKNTPPARGFHDQNDPILGSRGLYPTTSILPPKIGVTDDPLNRLKHDIETELIEQRRVTESIELP